MGLRLKPVAPRRGLAWIRQGFALWARRPLGFIGLFVFFLLGVLLLMVLVPVIGGLLGLATLPMLTLGFMIATRQVRAGGAVHALQFAEGLRHPDPSRRRAQWALCGSYALASMLVISAADWIDGGTFERLQHLLAGPKPASDELAGLLDDPRLAWGMGARLGLAALVSVPYWFAPALVHWAGQGVLQSLYSSTLALWRARGAFVLYFAGWTVMAIGVSAVVVLLATLTGLKQVIGVLTMPLGLVLSAAFYVSLWFGFADCFEGDEA